MIGWDAGISSDLRQSQGIAAVISAHNHHCLDLGAHLPDLRLPLLRGIADRVLDDAPRIAHEKMSPNLLKNLFVLGGLSDQQHFFQIFGQFRHLFRPVDDLASAFGISEQTDDLGMICIPDDNRMVAAAGMALDYRVYSCHAPAGRIQQCGIQSAQPLTHIRRDTVSTNDHLLPCTILKQAFLAYSLFLQHG